MENEQVQLEKIVASAEKFNVNNKNLQSNVTGAKKELKIGDILNFGWEIFKRRWKFLILLGLAYAGIIIAEEIFKVATKKFFPIYFLVSMTAIILSFLINIGIVQIFLKLSRGGSAKVVEIFGETRYFWKYAGASILVGLYIMLGLLLLVIPGIIWSVKYRMFAYLIVDKNMRPIEALKESAKITYGYKWKLFLFNLVAILVTLGGFLFLGIGVFVAFPVVALANAYIYRVLVGEDVSVQNIEQIA